MPVIAADSKLVGSLHASPNFGERRDVARPDILLLHYTGMHACARAIGWLATPTSMSRATTSSIPMA